LFTSDVVMEARASSDLNFIGMWNISFINMWPLVWEGRNPTLKQIFK
jgi:hypothetical protein